MSLSRTPVFSLLTRLGGRSKTVLSSVNLNLPYQRPIIKRCLSEECRILGIETSCDDTGCAVVDNNGNILGQALHSQQDIHIEHGGILPPLARDLHKEKIEVAVIEALDQSGVKLKELDAIAVTVKPGLSLSLLVGLEHAKHLACKANKPLIPIHHMEAHALTVRMEGKVTFPFLVLLMSGGHCLLSVVQSVDKFLTLGHTVDDAPGEALDKICRRLKLWNCKQWSGMSGGAAIENAAKSGDPLRFDIAEPLLHTRDCNFSFAGVKNSARKAIIQEEIAHGIEGDEIIPNVEDLCASVQLAVSKHLCRRLQRAMVYCMETKLITHPQPYLVLSGGVASNSFIRSAVELVASSLDWKVAAPPPSLCTDNGAMIAWNGVEWYLVGSNLVPPDKHHTVDIQPKLFINLVGIWPIPGLVPESRDSFLWSRNPGIENFVRDWIPYTQVSTWRRYQ